MKFLIIFLMFFSLPIMAAENSYIIKYNKETHSITVYKGSSNNLNEWKKETYLLDKNNKVIGINKSINEFVRSLEK